MYSLKQTLFVSFNRFRPITLISLMNYQLDSKITFGRGGGGIGVQVLGNSGGGLHLCDEDPCICVMTG